MKKSMICLVAALLCMSAQAAEEAPFAYADGLMAYARTYFFHSKCPAQNSNGWAYAQIDVSDGNGGDVGYACWVRTKNADQKKYPGYTIKICDLGSMRWVKRAALAQYDFAKDTLKCGSIDADKAYQLPQKPKASFN